MNPLLVRHFIYPLHELIRKRRTFSILRDIERTQWLSQEEVKNIQFTKLKKLLFHAYNTVPYYRRLMDNNNCGPDSIHDYNDFSKIPPLTKMNIRDAGVSLVSSNYDIRNLSKSTTSGSTAKAISFYVCPNREAYNIASEIRCRKWLGVNPFENSIWVWGRHDREKKISWLMKEIRDRIVNRKMFHSQVIDGDQVNNLLQELKKYRPKYLYCYAGAISYIAKFMRDNNIDGTSYGIKAIITTAEMLFEQQRKDIENVFNCLVANEYGAADAGFIAQECAHGRLHIQAEGIFVEVENSENNDNGSGELLITNLDSYAMPFIRYKIGDLGILSEEQCPCGRGLPILGELTGRSLGCLISREGRKINSMLAYFPSDGIMRYRLRQRTFDELDMVMEVNNTYDKSFETFYITKLEKLFGHRLKLTFRYVDKIETSSAGKYNFISSDVAKKLFGS